MAICPKCGGPLQWNRSGGYLCVRCRAKLLPASPERAASSDSLLAWLVGALLHPYALLLGALCIMAQLVDRFGLTASGMAGGAYLVFGLLFPHLWILLHRNRRPPRATP